MEQKKRKPSRRRLLMRNKYKSLSNNYVNGTNFLGTREKQTRLRRCVLRHGGPKLPNRHIRCAHCTVLCAAELGKFDELPRKSQAREEHAQFSTSFCQYSSFLHIQTHIASNCQKIQFQIKKIFTV
jgi:hypothetical protein